MELETYQPQGTGFGHWMPGLRPPACQSSHDPGQDAARPGPPWAGPAEALGLTRFLVRQQPEPFMASEKKTESKTAAD